MDPFPRLPQRAKASQAVLLRPLQDIDIFVEDGYKSKQFYKVLLGRVLGDTVNFYDIIPLGPRSAVEVSAIQDNGPRLSIYLVDGDLDWVAGKHSPTTQRLYVHQCYCVENYLFCQKAVETIIYENDGTLSEAEVQERLNWERFCDTLKPLVKLFIEYSISHTLQTGITTVSQGYSVVIESQKGEQPRISETKVESLITSLKEQILTKFSNEEYERIKEEISNRVEALQNKLSIVSGKDFLLHFQYFESKRVANLNMTTESLKLRLAKNCDISALSSINDLISELKNERNWKRGQF